jgi:hypothetical protein
MASEEYPEEANAGKFTNRESSPEYSAHWKTITKMVSFGTRFMSYTGD